MTDDPYESLAADIIIQAIHDYRDAGKKLKHHPKNKEAKLMIKDCERFFCSEWFNVLSEMDGKDLLKRLKEEEIS